MPVLLGKNSVLEALQAERPINKVLISRTAHGMTDLVRALRAKRVVVQDVDNATLDKHANNQRHQGVVALIAPFCYAELSQVIDASKTIKWPLIIALNEVQDPHNFGAIIRSAEAAGARAVIIPARRSCPLNETVEKAAAGAASHIPIVRVANLSNALQELKLHNYWVVGCDMDGANVWEDKTDLNMPLVLVVGGESKGLGSLVKENCDIIFSLPMFGQINSLNASVAAATMMFEIMRKRTQTK